MTAQAILTFAFYAAGLAAFLVVGRSNLKKQTIEDQARLIAALRDQNEQQAKQIEQLESKVSYLEEALEYGDPRVVYKRSSSSPRRSGRRDGSASSGPESKR